ncbi:MAG: glycosyltransferase [bacterium]
MFDLTFWIALAAWLIYTAIILFLISGLLQIKNKKRSPGATVSVVVAARNEEQNLNRCLQALLSQSYPKNRLQIILVDDRSTDGTAQIAHSFQKVHRNVEVICTAEQPGKISPKKYALMKGIKQANGTLIFTTDADCVPPPDWLSETVPLFQEDVGIVLGPAPFYDHQNAWHKLLALDNLAATVVSAGAAGWNVGVTCSGRNLAYRKQVFELINGFQKFQHSLSGDDDLFLQEVNKQTSWRIAYSLNPDTMVPSAAAPSFSAFVKQRRRHVSASRYYSRRHQVGYLLFNLANLYLFGFAMSAVISRTHLFAAAAFLGLKWGLDFLALFFLTHKLKQRHLLWWLPLWELFYLVNQVFISPLAFVGKIRWK